MVHKVMVEVSGIYFSAGHFVSEGGKCERLHGHNYHVSVQLVGEVDAHGMVVDFRVIKEHIRQLCKAWDHQLLLPAHSPLIKVRTKGTQTQVMTPDRRYVFPTQDVLVLDVIETTAEELARLLCQKLVEDLKPQFTNVHQISISVGESATQRATVTIAL